MARRVQRYRVPRSGKIESGPVARPFGLVLIAAALLGAGGMILEISLTRVFATLLFYNYVFLVIAIALLGLGLGALVVASLPSLRADPAERGADFALLAGITATAVAMLAANVLPPGLPLLSGAIAMVPFVCVGAAMPLLFAVPGASPHRVYGADLLGAAAGAVAVLPLLYLGAAAAVIVAGVLFGLASIALTMRSRGAVTTRALAVMLLVLTVVVAVTIRPIDISLARMTASKPLALWLQSGQATVLRSTNDPFSRVDVVSSAQNPMDRLVFIDGAAGSTLPHYPADSNEQVKRQTELGAFPYLLVNGDRVLVIGSGGGLGVLYGILGGATDITAVEVSPGVIDAVKDSGAFNGFLYDRPEVTVVADEGRSFLNRTDETFDIIDMSMVVSLAAPSGGLALTENYLFTEQAFLSVWQHLDDNGIAAIRMYDDPTLTRAVVTLISGLRAVAPSDAEALKHIAVVFDPKETTPNSPAFYPQILLSKQPLTPEAAATLVDRADKLGFTVMFAPYAAEVGIFGEIVRGEKTLAQALPELTGGKFTPVGDDAPFFFEMSGGLPKQLVRTWYALAAVLTVAAVAAGVMGRRTLGAAARQPGAITGLPYFFLLGIGFILVELLLLARVGLFIGHPTVAFTVVLSALLLFGGVGSLAAQRIPADRAAAAAAIAAAVSAVGAFALFLLFRPDSSLLGGLPLIGRMAVGLVVMAPLGLAMGVPFPSGLRLAGGEPSLPWAVNGAASVIGSVLATTLAIRFGYTVVTFVAVAAYLLAAGYLLVAVRPSLVVHRETSGILTVPGG